MMKSGFNLQQMIRSNVKQMQAYASARTEFKQNGGKMTFLDANENPFENGFNRYPDPQQQLLKEELAHFKTVESSQIILGNGSDEILDLIFRAFCEPGIDNIITLQPTYGMYRVLANLNGVEERSVNLSADFQLDLKTVFEATDAQTKIIFLCSPNNPTGNSLSIITILELLKNFPGLVVIDEAYIDFSTQKSCLTYLNEFSNLIITQTFSKAFGMAGIRLGIGFASKEIIKILNKIKPPYNVNALSQQKGLERLKKRKLVKAEIENILEQRELLETELKNIDFIKTIYPSDSNFILIRVDNAKKRYSQLLKAGIVVRNRTNQPLCENTLRISIGTTAENNLLITTLKKL